MTTTIKLTNVTKSFGGRKVINIDNLTLGSHPIEGLLGPTGAGKTTLMSLITQKLKADTGSIQYAPDGKSMEIINKRLDQVARLGLIRTNQVVQDFDSLSIKESLLLSISSPRYEKFYKLFGGNEAQEQIGEYLDYFQIGNLDGHALSASEKKLLDIIRCLALKPKFLLMDEPTAGLTDDQTRKVMDLIMQRATEDGMSILIVDHDLDLIGEVCEYVHFLDEGELRAQGTPEEIRQNKMVAEQCLHRSGRHRRLADDFCPGCGR